MGPAHSWPSDAQAATTAPAWLPSKSWHPTNAHIHCAGQDFCHPSWGMGSKHSMATSGAPIGFMHTWAEQMGLHALLLTSLRSLKVGTLRGALDTG